MDGGVSGGGGGGVLGRGGGGGTASLKVATHCQTTSPTFQAVRP